MKSEIIIKQILEDNNISRHSSLDTLIDEWEYFINTCKEGYTMNIYEYDNDVSVRKYIDIIISEENLKSSDYLKDRIKRLSVLDNNLKNILSDEFSRNEGENWWEKGILKKAYSDYADDILDLYDYEIEVLE